jgi:hypothetical protein
MGLPVWKTLAATFRAHERAFNVHPEERGFVPLEGFGHLTDGRSTALQVFPDLLIDKA